MPAKKPFRRSCGLFDPRRRHRSTPGGFRPRHGAFQLTFPLRAALGGPNEAYHEGAFFMGLTRNSRKGEPVDGPLMIEKEAESDRVIALAGNRTSVRAQCSMP